MIITLTKSDGTHFGVNPDHVVHITPKTDETCWLTLTTEVNGSSQSIEVQGTFEELVERINGEDV